MPGGVETGFNKMEKDVFRTRLLHVKGKRVVRVSEVSTSEKRDLMLYYCIILLLYC